MQTPLPLSSAALLSKLLPITLDDSLPVRSNLLKVLRAFRAEELAGQAEPILLHARAGLTHMAVGIRETALELLSVTLEAIPLELVSCAGGWIKTLRYFAMLLSWPASHGPDSTSTPKMYATSGAKLTIKGLEVTGQYLQAGLQAAEELGAAEAPGFLFPLSDTRLHRMPRTANAFAHLGLFRSSQSDDDVAFQDRSERQASFRRSLMELFQIQLAKAKREGGEVGRVAAQTQTAITESMADYEETD
jgi:pre-rRNA-processing protein IPI1